MKTGCVNIKDVITCHQMRATPREHLHFGKRIFSALIKRDYIKGNLKDKGASVFRPGIFKRIFVTSESYGLPYISASDINATDPMSRAKLLSVKYTDNMEEMKLEKGMSLLSCAGAIGDCTYINNILHGTIGSQDIIRVVPAKDSGFIFAYLSTKSVYEYLQSKSYGSVVPRLEPVIVEEIPVPKFNDEFIRRIDGMIKESARLREEAADTLDKAIKILDNYIGCECEETTYATAIVSIRDVFGSLQQRLDPPALMNNGVKCMKDVCNLHKWRILKETGAKVRRPGIFKRNYVENGIPYIKGSEIFNLNPFINSSLKIYIHG